MWCTVVCPLASSEWKLAIAFMCVRERERERFKKANSVSANLSRWLMPRLSFCVRATGSFYACVTFSLNTTVVQHRHGHFKNSSLWQHLMAKARGWCESERDGEGGRDRKGGWDKGWRRGREKKGKGKHPLTENPQNKWCHHVMWWWVEWDTDADTQSHVSFPLAVKQTGRPTHTQRRLACWGYRPTLPC